MSEIYIVKWYTEFCCNSCNEVIHNHFECPRCGHKYAGVMYPIDVEWYDIDIFSCEECGAKFRMIEYMGFEAKIKYIGDKNDF